jgi:hypothetical protein
LRRATEAEELDSAALGHETAIAPELQVLIRPGSHSHRHRLSDHAYFFTRNIPLPRGPSKNCRRLSRNTSQTNSRSLLLFAQLMNGTGHRQCRQFIRKAARLSSRAAFGRHKGEKSGEEHYEEAAGRNAYSSTSPARVALSRARRLGAGSPRRSCGRTCCERTCSSTRRAICRKKIKDQGPREESITLPKLLHVEKRNAAPLTCSRITSLQARAPFGSPAVWLAWIAPRSRRARERGPLY